MIDSQRVARFCARASGSLCVLAALAPAGCAGGGSAPIKESTRSTDAGLVLEHRGLLADYPFTKPAATSSLAPTFRLGGTAGTNSAAGVHSDGLYVRVGPHPMGSWRGFFAATSTTYPRGSVFRVRMWRPAQSFASASQSGVALFAVQTAASTRLNYVLVAGIIRRRTAYWTVGYATGNSSYAKTRLLWTRPIASTNEEISLRTDGHSSYAVYFGRTRVYASHQLKLNIEPPFRVYLEVEARGVSYQARFQDLSVAADNSVIFDGLRPGERVTLASDGNPPVRADASADGRARVILPLSEVVGTGTVTIDGNGVHRRFAGVRFVGGDVYRVRT